MRQNEIIEQSISYGILRAVFFSVLTSFIYKLAAKIVIFIVTVIRNAFATSDSRSLFHAIRARLVNNLYAAAQSTLCVILLCHLILDGAIYGKILCNSVVFVGAVMLALFAAKKGMFSYAAVIIRNSVVYHLLVTREI